MGLAIDRVSFAPESYPRFSERLEQSLHVLRRLLQKDGFGVGPKSFGAELEVSIVDENFEVRPIARGDLPAAIDDHITLELDRFNLEYNLSPTPLAGRPFSALERQLTTALETLDATVATQGGKVVPIGILPTLEPDHLEAHIRTDLPRYEALSRALCALRQEDQFSLDIHGHEELYHRCSDVTPEGAATSFQLHLRVDPEDFDRFYNAAQLATPIAIALAANSPLFLARKLWDETRIALFKQAVDARATDGRWRAPARVSFGHGWARGGAYDLFREAVALFAPLLPVLSDEDPVAVHDAGQLPRLEELRLHQSTVWRWNRAVYDPAAGGHVRIEFRSLPSGPSAVDMAASAAWLFGLTAGLAEHIDELLPAFPFEYAQHNFYRAAQSGLDAELLWPADTAPSPAVHKAPALCAQLMDTATEGLARLGIASDEAKRYLGVISDRLRARQTPARWQRDRLAHHESATDRRTSLRRMLAEYMDQSAANRPCHEW